MYLLDTMIAIAALNKIPGVIERLRSLPPEDIVLCAPVLAELKLGARRSARIEQNLEKIESLRKGARVEPFGESAADQFGSIKANLLDRGLPKTDFDLAIAAIALDINATLVTNDSALLDGSIPGLQVENWLRTV